jgi:hypothetical protein
MTVLYHVFSLKKISRTSYIFKKEKKFFLNREICNEEAFKNALALASVKARDKLDEYSLWVVSFFRNNTRLLKARIG